MPDIATVVTSASVAAVIAVVGTVWNGERERSSRNALRKADREHEVSLRELDRGHEDRQQERAERWRRRDQKVEELRANLPPLTEAALALGRRADAFKRHPDLFATDDPALQAAMDGLRTALARIVLNEQTDLLRKAVDTAAEQHARAILALHSRSDVFHSEDAKQFSEAAQRASDAVEKLHQLADEVVRVARLALEEAERQGLS
jgi:hypothetical protein